MTINLSIQRNFFTRSFSLEFSGEFESSPLLLTRFGDRFVASLPAGYFEQGAILRDVKGRDPRASIDGDPFPAPDTFELFAVEGLVTTRPSGSGNEFTLQVFTDFVQFEGAHHIEHRVRMERTGGLPTWVSPRSVARLVPVTLTQLKLGFDLYQSTYFTSLLGFTPEATRELLVEGNGKKIRFRVKAEKLTAPAAMSPDSPEAPPPLTALSSAVRACWNIDLAEEFRQRLET